jgi:hypothetical protein
MSNYIEFIILGNNTTEHEDKISIDIVQDKFEKALRNAKQNKLHIKCFHKSQKVYVRDNLYLEADKDSEITVFEKTPLTLNKKNKFVVLKYKRTRVPMHTFPSTTKLHTIYYSDSTIFRLHNRVFLNFESQYYPDKDTYNNKIYINYNHDPNAEQSIIKDKIEQAFKLLGESVAIYEIYDEIGIQTSV